MVLQRLQSVYLLIAAVVMAVYAFVSQCAVTVGDKVYLVGMTGVKDAGSASGIVDGGFLWAFFAVTILIAILAIVTIFQYKNLGRQRSLCKVGVVLTLALAVSLAIEGAVVECDSITPSLYNLLPLVAVVMFVLAGRGIRKDQKILSSYDRIR